MTSNVEPPIQYATPTVGRSYWPAAIFCFTGLGLIVLGGCFLIGVLILTNSPSTLAAPLSTSQSVLLMICFAMSIACFVAAAAMLIQSVRRLL